MEEAAVVTLEEALWTEALLPGTSAQKTELLH